MFYTSHKEKILRSFSEIIKDLFHKNGLPFVTVSKVSYFRKMAQIGDYFVNISQKNVQTPV